MTEAAAGIGLQGENHMFVSDSNDPAANKSAVELLNPTQNNIAVFGTLNESLGNLMPTVTEILTSNNDFQYASSPMH
jgi:hypothetical protein